MPNKRYRCRQSCGLQLTTLQSNVLIAASRPLSGIDARRMSSSRLADVCMGIAQTYLEEPMKRIFALLALLVLASGCANVSNGKDFDASAANEFVVGVTTIKEAIDVLGKPQRTDRNKEGRTRLAWQYLAVKKTGFTHTSQHKMLGVVFDEQGKFLRIP